MIKTADYIESQIRKINSDDGGVADRFVEIAKEAVEKMRDAMREGGIIK